MVAVDTNVVVRLVVGDHRTQAHRAAEVFRAGPVLVDKTVLLEVEWVLRHSYGISSPRIVQVLRGVLGLANVEVESPAQIAQALAGLEAGLDFADALHLASSIGAERFVTFDAKLVKRAARAGYSQVELVS